MPRKAKPKAEPVKAAGTAAYGAAVEEAMTKSVSQAYKDGITDPKEVRKRMLAARAEAVKAYEPK